ARQAPGTSDAPPRNVPPPRRGSDAAGCGRFDSLRTLTLDGLREKTCPDRAGANQMLAPRLGIGVYLIKQMLGDRIQSAIAERADFDLDLHCPVIAVFAIGRGASRGRAEKHGRAIAQQT